MPILFGIGAGLVGYVAWQEHAKRQEFRAHLSALLAEQGLTLVSADLGRSDANSPVWRLTVRHPTWGVYPFVAPLLATDDSYSKQTAANLAARVRQYFALAA